MNEPSQETGSEADYTKLVPIIWTALRLLGVYVVIVGITALIEDLTTMVARWQFDTTEHHSNTVLDYISSTFFSDLFWTAAGLYLLFGGKWLIENVFLPAKTIKPSINGDTADSA